MCFTLASLIPLICFWTTAGVEPRRKIRVTSPSVKAWCLCLSFYCRLPRWVTSYTNLDWSIHSYVSLLTNFFKLHKIVLENDEAYLYIKLTLGKVAFLWHFAFRNNNLQKIPRWDFQRCLLSGREGFTRLQFGRIEFNSSERAECELSLAKLQLCKATFELHSALWIKGGRICRTQFTSAR